MHIWRPTIARSGTRVLEKRMRRVSQSIKRRKKTSCLRRSRRLRYWVWFLRGASAFSKMSSKSSREPSCESVSRRGLPAFGGGWKQMSCA